MRVVVAVHDPPVWTMPAGAGHVGSQASLPDDEVVDARSSRRTASRLSGGGRDRRDQIQRGRSSSVRDATSSGFTSPPSASAAAPAALQSRVTSSSPTSRGVHSDAIAEHAIALALALRRRLHVAGVRARRRATGRRSSSHEPRALMLANIAPARRRPGIDWLARRARSPRARDACDRRPAPSRSTGAAGRRARSCGPDQLRDALGECRRHRAGRCRARSKPAR